MRELQKEQFRQMKMGLFYHFLDGINKTASREENARRWNARVNAFDTEALACQLHELGIPYFFITIGQCGGMYCAPNDYYDSLLEGYTSLLSERNLVNDLSDSLAKYGIRLGVYLPYEPALADEAVTERFGITVTEGYPFVRNEKSQTLWENCITNWSKSFGDKVFAWWIDGVGKDTEAMLSPTEPNYNSFTRAIRTGNPNALVALNAGIVRNNEIRDVSPKAQNNSDEDFTAGEVDLMMFADGINWEGKHMMKKEELNGEVLHMLSYLGSWWGGKPEPRLNDFLAAGITKYVNSMDGVVTWDVPFNPDGTVAEAMVGQIKAIMTVVKGGSLL